MREDTSINQPEAAHSAGTLAPELEAILDEAAHMAGAFWQAAPPLEDRQPYFSSIGEDTDEVKAKRKRYAAYLHDLGQVLRTPGGAGVRVVQHWLEAAGAFDAMCQPEPQVYFAAALADYARQRLAEIALADPKTYVRVQLAEAAAFGRGMVLE